MAGEGSKYGNISNKFYVRGCCSWRRSAVHWNRMLKGHLQAFFSLVVSNRDRVAESSFPMSPLVSSLALSSPPNETFASHNLACSQLSNSHGRRPKMIYTRCFSQHKRPCTAKLQNRCQAIRLHSGGLLHRTARSVLTGLFVLSCFMF